MLEGLFGNKSMELVLLNLFHYSSIHGRAIARNINQYPSAIAKQLDKLEAMGLVVSQEQGRTRVYQFNPKSPYVKPLKDLLAITYNSMSYEMKRELFAERGRPRAKGKEIIKK